MRVLMVKTSSLGDVIHTLPALTDAMRALPGIQFDWVVEEGFAEIPSWHPAVDKVIPVALRRWRKKPLSGVVRQQWQAYQATLKEREYDCVIDAQGLVKSAALVTRWARGPRHGYDSQSAREPLASWFYQHKHRVDKEQHAVERIRQLLSQALDYPLPDSVADYAILDQFEPALEPYLVGVHSTTRDNKHWPEPLWRELLTRLDAQGQQVRLPWGNELEHQRAIRLAQDLEHIQVMPKTNLKQVAGQLAGARAVISVDTGIAHLAAALDKPQMVLYGPTRPGLIGSYGRDQVHLQASDGDLSNMTVDQVLEQLDKTLDETTEKTTS